MADLTKAGAANPPNTSIRPGAVVADSAGILSVNVDGTKVDVLWPVGCFFRAGDVVRVLTAPTERAQVLAPVLTAPRPVTGTVAGAASGGRVPVSTSVGTVQCRYTGTAPANGVLVRLDWAGTDPWVWSGTVASIAGETPVDPGTGPQPPAGNPTAGTERFSAIESLSWAGHRGTWSSTTRSDLIQGSWQSFGPYSGSWWYGAAPGRLKGRVVTRFSVYLGARVPGMGDHNLAATFHLYRHTQLSRGASEPPRAALIADVTREPDAPAGWVDLTATAGVLAQIQQLVDSGGGISVYGNPYAGLRGVGADPSSGRIEIGWSR